MNKIWITRDFEVYDQIGLNLYIPPTTCTTSRIVTNFVVHNSLNMNKKLSKVMVQLIMMLL